MTTAIITEALTKTYRTGLVFGQRVRALNGIHLKVPEGGVFGLLGPNGAGKTTLIKILLGIVRPTTGRAMIFNQPHNRQATRQKIGYLPEHFQVARHHTAVTALYFLGRLSRMGESEIRKKIPELIELVGLRGRENELVRTYSKGMKQRLGLAQALLHDPKLIFLDEPTDGLDPVGRHHVRQCIEKLKSEGKTIFLNSHILQEVELVCDQFAIMAKGNVAASGTLNELLSLGAADQTNTVVQAIGTRTSLERALQQLHSQLDVTCRNDLEVERSTIGSRVNDDSIASTTPSLEGLAGVATSTESLAVWTCILKSVVQSDIDQLVDGLRKNELSITSLAVHRPKLEQIFMQLVQGASPQIETSNK